MKDIIRPQILPIQLTKTTKQKLLNTTLTMSTPSETKTTTTMSREEIRAANSDPNQGVSICIPRVFNNIGWRRVKQTFIDLRWGFIDRVDVIPCGKFKRAYVHFAPGKWNMRDSRARSALTSLQNGDEVKILYDEPWFWKISISSSVKPAEAPKPAPRPKVTFGRKKTIDLDESNITQRSPERKKARKLRIAKKAKVSAGGVNMNDPITARAMENSPKSASDELSRRVVAKEITSEELKAMPSKLRDFDDAEAAIEEGEVQEFDYSATM